MNLASPKLGGKQNAFVLLPSGHGGSRTLILTPYGERAPFYMSCDSFSGLPRLAESRQERTDALSLTRGQRVSGSHKPRPPKFKLPGLPRSITLGTGTRRPRSATTYTVGAGSTAGGANFARLLRRFAAAVVVGLKDGFHPLSAASCGNRKELTPLSDHAFVRSMVRVWCHLRHQAEKLASSTKAFIIITLIIKNATIYQNNFYISPASRSFSNCNIPL